MSMSYPTLKQLFIINNKYFIQLNNKRPMLANRLFRRVMCFSSEQQIINRAPKAPKLLSGQLQTFRFDMQNAKLYDGYTLDELYGSKIGAKHPPSIRAQMKKDTIASLIILVLGFSIILHVSWLNKQQVKELKALTQGRLRRKVEFAQDLTSPIKVLV